MHRYKNILLAVDLKPEDDIPVSEKAKNIAEIAGADISIVHVVEPIYDTVISPGAEMNVEEWESEHEESAKNELAKLGESLSVPKERQHLQFGQIKDKLLGVAKKINADLIVVGTHSKGGVKSIFIGDTADDMLHFAKCDISAVHVYT